MRLIAGNSQQQQPGSNPGARVPKSAPELILELLRDGTLMEIQLHGYFEQAINFSEGRCMNPYFFFGRGAGLNMMYGTCF